jgi:hypothetical protein
MHQGFSADRLMQGLFRKAKAAGFDHPVASLVMAASAKERDFDRASDVPYPPLARMLTKNISKTKTHPVYFTESKFDFL